MFSEGYSRNLRIASQVRRPHAKQVAYVPMVIVGDKHDFARDLPLDANMESAREWRLEAGIHGNRECEDAGRNEVHRQVAEPAPKEEPRLMANRCARRVGELLRAEASEGLNVAQIYYGVR